MSITKNTDMKTITQDVEEAYADLTIFQRDDMVVTKIDRISTRYMDTPTIPMWLTKEIGRNNAGDVCYVKRVGVSPTKPAWIPNTTQYNSL